MSQMVINNKHYGRKLKVSKPNYFQSNIVFLVTNGQKKKTPKREKSLDLGL
jgi:hypothetical protein